MQPKPTERNSVAPRAIPRDTGSPVSEARKVRVKEIMTRPALCSRRDMAVETVIELMLSNGFSRVPVVDEQDKLVGMVSKTDLLAEQFARGETTEWVLEEGVPWREGVPLAEQGFHIYRPGSLVGEVMKAPTLTVQETSTIAEAAELMAIHQLHGVPVVSAAKKVTGMLSLLDIVGWVAGLIPS